VTPLIGYTTAGQFWIIVRYYERGTLSTFLPTAPESIVTPLFLSELVWGIASGMAIVHGHKIIHRDLKAGNVWLDNSLRPRITDFWNSRPFVADRLMTKRIGTINVMAPEVMNGNVYDEAVDVFSFGTLVYFICEKRQSFEGLDDSQIVSAVTTDQRPEFSEKTPEKTRRMIEKCWARDPAVRPTFAGIADAIARGSVRFPGTRKRELTAAIRALTNTEQPVVLIPSEEDFPNLENPADPGFEEALDACVATVGPVSFERFFAVLSRHFDGQISPVIRRLIAAMRTMTLRGVEFVDAICRTEFYELPVLRDPQLADDLVPFVAQLMCDRPSQIRPFMKPFLKALIKSRTKALVKLLWRFVCHVNVLERPIHTLDIYLESAPDILRDDDTALDFLRILYHLSLNSQIFRENRFSIVRKLLSQFLLSTSGQILIETWRFIALLYDTEFVLPPEIVASHICNRQLVDLVVSVYLRMPRLPPHRLIIEAFLSHASQSPRVLNILFRLAAQQPEIGAVILSTPVWITQGLDSPLNALRLLMVLLCHPQLRQLAGATPGVAAIFTEVFALRTEEVIIYLTGVFRLIPCWPLLAALEQAGFVAAFIAFALEIGTPSALEALFLFVDAAGRVGFSPAFVDLCPRLWKMVESAGATACSAVQLLVLMSTHQACIPTLKNPVMVAYFTKIADCETYRELALVFLRNVGALQAAAAP
jgi:hypothetical protein